MLSWRVAAGASNGSRASKPLPKSARARNGAAGPPDCGMASRLRCWPSHVRTRRRLASTSICNGWRTGSSARPRSGKGRRRVARFLPRSGGGAAPDGAEVWANADQFLADASIGAPPDPFAEGGQNWGLKAPNPLAWRKSGYRLFREVLAANMAGAGALRIDHAMGLTRLFVIPNGAPADEGAYLAFPERDLIAELALESRRAACVIVGEDLGTVPVNFRPAMDAANILSYRVMWFEREGGGFARAESYPRKSVACVTTHDLPTIAGWWQGEDIREKEALGLIPAEAAEAAREERTALKQALPADDWA